MHICTSQWLPITRGRSAVCGVHQLRHPQELGSLVSGAAGRLYTCRLVCACASACVSEKRLAFAGLGQLLVSGKSMEKHGAAWLVELKRAVEEH